MSMDDGENPRAPLHTTTYRMARVRQRAHHPGQLVTVTRLEPVAEPTRTSPRSNSETVVADLQANAGCGKSLRLESQIRITVEMAGS